MIGRRFRAWLAYSGGVLRRSPGLAVAWAVIGSIGPVAFVQRRWLITVAALLALALASTGVRRVAAVCARSPLVGVVVLFAAWVLVAAAWAPALYPGALGTVLGCAAIGTVTLAALDLVPPVQRRQYRIVLSASVLLLAALLAAEAATGGALSGALPGRAGMDPHRLATVVPSRPVPVLVLLLWAAAGMIAGARRRLAIPIAVAVVLAADIVVFALDMRAAKLAFIVGLAVALPALRAPRVTVWIAGGLAAAYVLAAPAVYAWLITPGVLRGIGIDLPISGVHRIAMWNQTAQWIGQAPLFGWGFGASRWLSGLELRVPIDTVPPMMASAISLHPHNLVLQLWLELGLVGVLLFLFVLVALARGFAAQRPGRVATAVAAGTAASAACFALLSFGAWDSWWLAVLILAAFAVRLHALDRPTVGAPSR